MWSTRRTSPEAAAGSEDDDGGPGWEAARSPQPDNRSSSVNATGRSGRLMVMTVGRRAPPAGSDGPVPSAPVRLVIARCSVDYIGRLTAHLPMATRLLLVKADGSVSIHADDRAYKPLNWMSPPCSLKEELSDGSGSWTVTNKRSAEHTSELQSVEHDHRHELGADPGLQKDGVEDRKSVV